ncbi:MAG: hypothetical protein HN350_18570 [Phycisphaerales bacterium]|nr:hypothetical protein [Phycisphaerales bacterium]
MEALSLSHHAAVETVHRVRKWMLILTVGVVVSWIVIAVAIMSHRASLAGEGVTSGKEFATTNPLAASNGPWGELEYTPIVISAPQEYVAEGAVSFAGPVVWHFPKTSAFGLTETLEKSGLPKDMVWKLKKIAKPNPALSGISLHPTKEFVLGLQPEDRAKLYLALADYPQNIDVQTQFLFRGQSPDQWFAGSKVSPEIRKLVEPLIYRYGNFMFFADLRTIFSDIPDRREQLELLKTLRRDATYLVHLKVSAKSDLDALVHYWGRGGRVQEVRPILEALIQSPGEHEINITHLLPPLARRALYTYPARSMAESNVHRDCHWTALNFFNETPDDKLATPEAFHSTITKDFYRIHGNLQLGDIAVVVSKQRKVLHSATYIADDIFFHRCGADSSAPWTLVKGEDLKSFYPRSSGVQLNYYRRKAM